MRLRLDIQRHELPAVKILINVPSEPTTISKLLELVNDLVPLESDGWGLEDYVVSMGDYECVHYLDANTILKEDDAVSIRALQSSDIRRRNVSGRIQISSAGAHLLDGITFGRNYFKRPKMRPQIHIPPRKPRRLSNDLENDDNWEHAASAVSPQPLRIALDEDDSEYIPHPDQLALRPYREGLQRRRSGRIGSRALLDPKELKDILGVENVPPFDIYEDDGVLDTDSFGSSSSDDSHSSSSDSSNHGPPEQMSSKQHQNDQIQHPPNITSSTSNSSDDSSDSSSSSASSSDDSDSDSDASPNLVTSGPAPPTEHTLHIKAQVPAAQTIPPGQGLKATRYRNLRRKKAKLFKRFGNEAATDQPERLRIPQDHEPETGKPLGSQKKTFEQQREKLLSMLNAGGVDVDANLSQSQQPGDTAHTHEQRQEESPTATQNTPKRRKLDLESSRRLLFGSLGVRRPKTKVDEDNLRARLAASVKPAGSDRPAPLTATAQAERSTGDTDPDAWKSKINLSAYECYDEDVVLCMPSFPFQQRWDPQYQSTSKSKKRKRQSQPRDSRPEQEDAGLTLNYDDDNAVVNKQNKHLASGGNGKTIPGTQREDLPILPADVNVLPVLTFADCVPGAIIAFKQLEISKKTSWQPQISSYRSASVLAADGQTETVTICLALRDRSQSEVIYDDDGNRVYGKFEAQESDGEDDAEDDGIRDLAFDDLIESKIVEADQSSQPLIVPLEPSFIPDSINQALDISGDDDSNVTEKPDNLSDFQPAQQEVSVSSVSQDGLGRDSLHSQGSALSSEKTGWVEASA